MDSRWFGLIELLLVFGLILAWAGWQWWDWWTWRKRQQRDAARDRNSDRDTTAP